jgi:hypothetical protein
MGQLAVVDDGDAVARLGSSWARIACGSWRSSGSRTAGTAWLRAREQPDDAGAALVHTRSVHGLNMLPAKPGAATAREVVADQRHPILRSRQMPPATGRISCATAAALKIIRTGVGDRRVTLTAGRPALGYPLRSHTGSGADLQNRQVDKQHLEHVAVGIFVDPCCVDLQISLLRGVNGSRR